jgi:hypothetical protein
MGTGAVDMGVDENGVISKYMGTGAVVMGVAEN